MQRVVAHGSLRVCHMQETVRGRPVRAPDPVLVLLRDPVVSPGPSRGDGLALASNRFLVLVVVVIRVRLFVTLPCLFVDVGTSRLIATLTVLKITGTSLGSDALVCAANELVFV